MGETTYFFDGEPAGFVFVEFTAWTERKAKLACYRAYGYRPTRTLERTDWWKAHLVRDMLLRRYRRVPLRSSYGLVVGYRERMPTEPICPPWVPYDVLKMSLIGGAKSKDAEPSP